MKVRELLEQLSQLNPDATVQCTGDGELCELLDIVIRDESLVVIELVFEP